MRHTSHVSLKQLGAAVLLSFVAGSAAAAFTDRGAPHDAAAATVIVNRAGKGDRLPLALPPGRPLSGVSPRTTWSKRIPLACDPAFGSASAAAHASPRCRS